MKIKKIPMRRCVACMDSKPKQDLQRIAYYEEKLTIDPTGKANGRGVYLCKNPECIEKAKKRKALQRSFGALIAAEEIDKVFSELENGQK